MKPRKNAEDFFTRKARYALTVMVVCDYNKKFMMVEAGWPGSTHDTRVYMNSPLEETPGQFFADEEYLLADAGYPLRPHLLPVYRRAPRQQLSPEQNAFNRSHSAVRIRIEHAIGMVKARFQSLKELRIVLDGTDVALFRALRWVVVCFTLHNFCIADVDEDRWIVANMTGQEAELNNGQGASVDDMSSVDRLVEDFMSSLHQPVISTTARTAQLMREKVHEHVAEHSRLYQAYMSQTTNQQ